MSDRKVPANVFPVDVKQFADMLGIEESTAYGMLRFCHEMSLCDITKRPQPQGKKGKPATIYLLNAKHVAERLGELLVKKFDKVKFSPELLAQPAANDDAAKDVQADTNLLVAVAGADGDNGGEGGPLTAA